MVSTHLENIRQIGSFPQVGAEKKKYLSCHHLVKHSFKHLGKFFHVRNFPPPKKITSKTAPSASASSRRLSSVVQRVKNPPLGGPLIGTPYKGAEKPSRKSRVNLPGLMALPQKCRGGLKLTRLRKVKVVEIPWFMTGVFFAPFQVVGLGISEPSFPQKCRLNMSGI